MPSYKAPLRDMRFLLSEIVAMERLRAMVERWRGAGGTSPAPAE